MELNITLTSQEEKALAYICADPTGVKEKDLQEHLGINRNEMLELLTGLKRKGFKFNGMPTIRLSDSYAHYVDLMKKFDVTLPRTEG